MKWIIIFSKPTIQNSDIVSIDYFYLAVERTQERKLEEFLLQAAREGETGKLAALVYYTQCHHHLTLKYNAKCLMKTRMRGET